MHAAAGLAGAEVRLAAYYFTYFAYAGAMLPYFALYLESLGLRAAQIALVLAMPQIARVFAPAFWGWVADRAQWHRAIVVLSGVALVIGYGALFWIDDVYGIAAVMLALSVASAGAMPIVESLALSALGAQSGRYGPVRLWGSVSFILGVLLTGFWLDRSAPSSLLVIIWVLALGALVAACGLPARPLRSEAAPDAPRFWAVLRQPEVVRLLAACFCMVVAHGALYAFYSIHLSHAGYSKLAIGALWTLGVLAEIVVFIALPRLLRRFSLRQLLLGSFLAAGLRFVVIGWAVDWVLLLAAAQLLHAATFGVYHAASVAMIHRAFSGAQQARGQAVYSSVSYGLGGAAGTLLAGWSWAALGPGWTFTISSLAGLVGAALLAWRVTPREV
ncbi:MAG TPA: MFS transporter [Burkholderiales bacterium]|nr:MFS transporter [Burkholderiales bacterium]